MDKLFEILKDFIPDPTVEKFWIIVVIGGWQVISNWKSIEDYFRHRSLGKLEQHMNTTTDHEIKKMLGKLHDQEVLFKITGIRQVDIAKKVMKLLVHSSLVLSQRDMDFYRPSLYLEKCQLRLKNISKMSKLSNLINIVTLYLVLFALAIFINGAIYLLVNMNVLHFNPLLIAYILMGAISFGLAMFIKNLIPKSNEKEMQELLQDFNNSENN